MTEKSPDRLAVLAKIDELERQGLFSHDVEDDPPTIPLTPDKVDYLGKKLSSKIKTRFVNICAMNFINKLIREKKLIIKEIIGIENFTSIKSGMIITCNHFNAFDNFAIHKVVEPYVHHNRLFKVIREGNFTSFPGLYGWFFRNCCTLPLSSNYTTMKLFLEAMNTLLKRGEKVLVYPEQGMWWNYRKPRPLTIGAYKFAVASDVPICPMFITMNDSSIIDDDGFPVQEYTIHVLPAIYPKEDLSNKENAEYMKQKNYEVWKDVYEKTYNIPLTYLK